MRWIFKKYHQIYIYELSELDKILLQILFRTVSKALNGILIPDPDYHKEVKKCRDMELPPARGPRSGHPVL